MGTKAVTWASVKASLVKTHLGCLVTHKPNATRNVEGIKTNIRKRMAAEAGMDPNRRIYSTCLDPSCVEPGHLTYKAPSLPSPTHEHDGLHNAKERLAALTEVTAGCHLFKRVAKNGYGRFWICRELGKVFAHRAAYMLLVGPIPPLMVVRHLCHNPSCLKPSHLAVGTMRDNTQDSVRAERMHWHRRARHEVAPLKGSIRCIIPCDSCGTNRLYYRSVLANPHHAQRLHHFCNLACRTAFDRDNPGVRYKLRRFKANQAG